jgi:hypothetical protein
VTVFTGPKYQHPYNTDSVHLQNTGYLAYGEKLAITVDRYEQGNWQGAFRPVSFQRSAAVVTIGFAVPYPPMVWDGGHAGPHQSGTYAAWALGKGFEARDDSGLITINSVTIAYNTVVLTLARTPSTNLFISYADTGESPNAGAGFTNAGGRCGLLRDSDPAVGRTAQSGNVYASWCPQFVQAVA